MGTEMDLMGNIIFKMIPNRLLKNWSHSGTGMTPNGHFLVLFCLLFPHLLFQTWFQLGGNNIFNYYSFCATDS